MGFGLFLFIFSVRLVVLLDLSTVSVERGDSTTVSFIFLRGF